MGVVRVMMSRAVRLLLAGAVCLVAGVAAVAGAGAAVLAAGLVLIAAGLFGDFDPPPADDVPPSLRPGLPAELQHLNDGGPW